MLLYQALEYSRRLELTLISEEDLLHCISLISGTARNKEQSLGHQVLWFEGVLSPNVSKAGIFLPRVEVLGGHETFKQVCVGGIQREVIRSAGESCSEEIKVVLTGIV